MAEYHNKSDTAPVPDSWGISRMNVVSIKYHWKIENYSYWDRKGEDYIGSPYFFMDKMPDIKWQMRLYPKKINIEQTVIDDLLKLVASLRLLLVTSNESSVKAKCNFSVLNSQGMIISKISASDFHSFKKTFGSSQLTVDLRFNEANFSNNDDFTVMCEINMCKGSVYIQGPSASTLSDHQDSEKNRHRDFENLLKTGRLSDVTLVLPGGASIPAHKSILAARSPVFAEMFEAQMRDSQTSNFTVIEVEECVMRELLRWVYTEHVENIENIVFKLLGATDSYKIDGLRDLCVDTLARKLNEDNASEILELAKLYNLEGLKRKAINLLAAKRGNPLSCLDASDVVCSESPDTQESGRVERVRRIVKSKIIDKIFHSF